MTEHMTTKKQKGAPKVWQCNVLAGLVLAFLAQALFLVDMIFSRRVDWTTVEMLAGGMLVTGVTFWLVYHYFIPHARQDEADQQYKQISI